MSFISVFLVGALFILFSVCILWIISLFKLNASIIDIFWGIGFILVTWIYYTLTPDGFLWRKHIIVFMVTIWGLRLSIYLLRRNWGKGEDFRYKNWRDQHSTNWWFRSLFQVFLLQGGLLCIISIPLLVAQNAPLPSQVTIFDGLGIMFWLLGFGFEAVADWQLARFRSNPNHHGKVMKTGLWRFTRHPNYFGESVLWWGYGLIATSVPFGFLSLFSPLVMTFLLVKVSGVSMLEKTMLTTKPDYQTYINTTSSFIPKFPKQLEGDRDNSLTIDD